MQNHKNQQWVFNGDIEARETDPGLKRKVLAFCDQAMCIENHFEAGGIGPLHSHPHTQITYIAEGRFRFTIGDTEHEIKKGDSFLTQNSVIHGCVCLEKGIVVDFFTPMRNEFAE